MRVLLRAGGSRNPTVALASTVAIVARSKPHDRRWPGPAFAFTHTSATARAIRGRLPGWFSHASMSSRSALATSPGCVTSTPRWAGGDRSRRLLRLPARELAMRRSECRAAHLILVAARNSSFALIASGSRCAGNGCGLVACELMIDGRAGRCRSAVRAKPTCSFDVFVVGVSFPACDCGPRASAKGGLCATPRSSRQCQL
jgi:hypothetical protein